MRKFAALIALVLILVPTVAMAAYFMADENLPKGEIVMGNLYLAGGNPTMAGDVQGDLYMSGGNVAVTGNVSNDLVVAGGNVSVTGNINDDLRVFGGQIYIDGKVNGEVIAFGGDVKLGPNAQVRKDLVVGGGNVEVDNNAKVYGTTEIYSDPEGKKGMMDYEYGMEKMSIVGKLIAALFTVISFMIVAAVMMGLMPNVVTKYLVSATSKGNFWKSFGLGLLLLIVTPICALLCFITGVGVMLGFLILAMYLMYILLNVALAGVLFGSLMQKWIMKLKKAQMNWLWGLGGIVVLHLLTLIPIIGFFVGAVFFLYSLGAVFMTDWKVMKAVK